MRRAHAVDENQAALVSQLRQLGVSVQSMAGVGNGAPDLVVGWKGSNHLFEVKDGRKIPSKRVLTEAEQVWHRDWRGTVHVVECLEDALGVLGLMR